MLQIWQARRVQMASVVQPNLAALPVIPLWLFPDKLSIAYSVYLTDRRALAVCSIVGPNRIEITQDPSEIAPRMEAMHRGNIPASPRTYPESAAP